MTARQEFPAGHPVERADGMTGEVYAWADRPHTAARYRVRWADGTTSWAELFPAEMTVVEDEAGAA